MNYKFLFCLFFSFLVSAEEIEVRLKTASLAKPLYLTHTYLRSDNINHGYLDELRTVLQFDLNSGAFVTVLPTNSAWEESLHMADVKRHFNVSLWRKEQVPFILCSTVIEKNLKVTAFDVEKGNSKVYEEIVLTGQIDEDRKQIHRLSDSIHRDFFGVEGVATCRIIYSLRESKGALGYRSEIYLSDFDGFNRHQLTFENDYCVTPCFSPYNKSGTTEPSFFYVSYKTGQSKIYRSTLKGSNSECLFEMGGNQLLPSLNLRASQMAFISDVAGRPDLFVQNLDATGHIVGKPKQLFSAPRATQASSAFSPDGKKIAFVSDKDGPPRIYVIDLTKDPKSRPQVITKKNRENTSPSWSPDGKKLSYSSKVDGVRQIWIYDVESQEETGLTFGVGNKENPAWAPDSLHLVYNTDQNEEGELFLIDVNKKTAVQISKGVGQKRFASWEPRKS
jgi:TolB protein